MHKVLFISFLYPPLGGVGVLRSLKFTRYLPQYGWDPVVLAAGLNTSGFKDPALLREIPPGVAVVRVPCIEPTKLHDILHLPKPSLSQNASSTKRDGVKAPDQWTLTTKITATFLQPDDKVLWLWPAYRAGAKLLARGDTRAIYSTSFPYTSHILAYLLKRKTGLPWVADFRDAWTLYPYRYEPSPLHHYLARKMESLVLRNADLITTVSDPVANDFQQAHPHISPTKFHVIPNGFDSEDYPPAPPRHQRTSELVIGYVGNLYGQYHNPEPFLVALGELLRERPELRELIQFRCTGTLDWFNTCIVGNLLNRYGLEKNVRMEPHTTHAQALERMAEADLLLLLVQAGYKNKGVHTAKLFEYLNTDRPILALVADDSVAAECVKRFGAGQVMEPHNIGAIKEYLGMVATRWLSGEDLSMPRQGDLGEFERSRLTGRLAHAFSTVTGTEASNN